MPGAVRGVGFLTAFTNMPINMAITDAPIKCSPALSSSISRLLAMAAITIASAIPGKNFVRFFIIFRSSQNLRCLFILRLLHDKIKA